ncbi:MAG: hypothetical protein GY718_10045 [Lentisphaerae bacterium]|nr:hypothetical protein [Lentisphaerota bacterium]
MESTEDKVIIDGTSYYIVRTISGASSIYKGVSYKHEGHVVHEPTSPEWTLEEGDMIIIARER